MGATTPTGVAATLADVLALRPGAPNVERFLAEYGVYVYQGQTLDEEDPVMDGYVSGMARAASLATLAGVCLNPFDHKLHVAHSCLGTNCVDRHWYHFTLRGQHLTIWTEWCPHAASPCPKPRPRWVTRVLVRALRRLLDAHRGPLRDAWPDLRRAQAQWPRWTRRRTRKGTMPEVLLGEARWLHDEDSAGTLKTGSDPPPGNEPLSSIARRTPGRQ